MSELPNPEDEDEFADNDMESGDEIDEGGDELLPDEVDNDIPPDEGDAGEEAG
jgi:hypothetical protein